MKNEVIYNIYTILQLEKKLTYFICFKTYLLIILITKLNIGMLYGNVKLLILLIHVGVAHIFRYEYIEVFVSYYMVIYSFY